MKRRSCFVSALLMGLLVALVCSPLQARSIPGAPNEVLDPWFENPDNGWYVEPGLQPWDPGNPQYPTITMPNAGNLPGGYLDPGRNPGDVVFIRTIVDDYEGLWNDEYQNKEIDLSLFAHLDGDGYVKVWFDWWNDPNIPRPSNDPNGQCPPPDGIVGPYVITADGSNDFEIIPPNAGEEPDWMDLYSFHDIWDHQPRWVSIEIEAGISQGPAFGGEAIITGIDFEARCVPEPTTVAMLLGMVGFGLLVLNRRR